jgi:hypothetical protein
VAEPVPAAAQPKVEIPRPEPEPVPAFATKPVEEKITIDEVRALMEAGVPLALVDVRTERSYRDDDLQATGAIRLPPDDAVRLAREMRLSQHATLVLYCA